MSGPFVDKFSRRKTIYTLDFISSGVYLLFALAVFTKHMNFGVFLSVSIITGCISSVYGVAYESFYPLLISEGNYTKAYSIAGTLESLSFFMVPLGILMYKKAGIGYIFLLDTMTFLVAAVCETQIKIKEEYVKKEDESFGFKQYIRTYKEGLPYLKS